MNNLLHIFEFLITWIPLGFIGGLLFYFSCKLALLKLEENDLSSLLLAGALTGYFGFAIGLWYIQNTFQKKLEKRNENQTSHI